MSNEEVKPLQVIDYIDRFQVFEILDKYAGWFAEPPVYLKELELIHEIKTRIKDISSINDKTILEHSVKNNIGVEIANGVSEILKIESELYESTIGKRIL